MDGITPFSSARYRQWSVWREIDVSHDDPHEFGGREKTTKYVERAIGVTWPKMCT